ncbi:hypothetical protein N9L68_09045 [bacterium]|nr:hypothetical protein [bacterium]
MQSVLVPQRQGVVESMLVAWIGGLAVGQVLQVLLVSRLIGLALVVGSISAALWHRFDLFARYSHSETLLSRSS